MGLMVVVVDGSHRLAGDGVVVDLANRWLAHLEVRGTSRRGRCGRLRVSTC